MWPSHGWRSADFVVKPQPDDVRRIQALYGVGTGTIYGTGLTAPPIWPPATSLPGWPPATTYWPAWPNYTRGTTYRPYYTTRRPYYTTRRPYFTTRRPYKRPKPDSNDNFISKLPPDISGLPHLKRLDLSNNKLRFLPSEIGDLIQLRELMVNNNLLRSLPYELGRCFQLQSLGLKGNPLAAEIIQLYLEPNGTRKLLEYMLDNQNSK